jgi:hypothetical protein
VILTVSFLIMFLLKEGRTGTVFPDLSLTGAEAGINESFASTSQLQTEQSHTPQTPAEKCDVNEAG